MIITENNSVVENREVFFKNDHSAKHREYDLNDKSEFGGL